MFYVRMYRQMRYGQRTAILRQIEVHAHKVRVANSRPPIWDDKGSQRFVIAVPLDRVASTFEHDVERDRVIRQLLGDLRAQIRKLGRMN